MYGHRARIGYTSPPVLTEVFPYEFYRTATGRGSWTGYPDTADEFLSNLETLKFDLEGGS